MHTTPHPPYAPAAPVLTYAADGSVYLTPVPTAPLTHYQQPTPAPVMFTSPAAWLQQPYPGPAVDGRDPWPARLLCGGIGIGAASVGIGFLLQAIAAATTGLGFIAAALAAAWLLKNTGSGGGGGRGAVSVSVTNRMTNRNH